MRLEKVLEQFDLNEKKTGIYLACLELGPSTAWIIAKRARVKRTTTYDILEDLIRMGFVTCAVRKKKKYFLAEDPEILKKILHEKERALKEVLPQLKSIYNIPGVKPSVRFYEGASEIRNIFRESLFCRKKEILAILPPVDIYAMMGIDFMRDYVANRVKLKIKNRVIRVKAREAEEKYFLKHKEQLREVRYAPKAVVFYSTIIIFDDKVGIITSKKESFGLLIKSKEYSQTMKELFEIIWRQTK